MLKDTGVFGYLNYRLFLNDQFKFLKRFRRFTLRQFAERAAIKTPGMLKWVVDNQRNLTLDTAKRFAEALELKGKEVEYFVNLVEYNQTDDPNRKAVCFDHLVRLRPRSKIFRQDKRENRYFSRHYYVVIREMVALPDFHEDYEWIGKRCFPNISPTQVKQAVESLIKLGLLTRDDSGKLVQGEDINNHRDFDTQVVEAYHFHESALDKARRALTDLPQEERHFHVLTIPMPKAMVNEILSDYQKIREKVLKWVNADLSKTEEIYQMNFQIFPVTKKNSADASGVEDKEQRESDRENVA